MTLDVSMNNEVNTYSKDIKAEIIMNCWKKTTKCIIFTNSCWHWYSKWLLLFYCYSLWV